MSNVWDFNRDRIVDATDVAIPQQNISAADAALQLIAAPAASSLPSQLPIVPPTTTTKSPDAKLPTASKTNPTKAAQSSYP